VQIDIDLVVDVQLFDLVTSAGPHQAGQSGLLGLEVDEPHEGQVLDVLGVLDQTGGDLPEGFEGLLQLLLGDALFEVSSEDILFVLVVLMDISQILYSVGLLLGPVHVETAALAEGVGSLQVVVGIVGLCVVLEADEGEGQPLGTVHLDEETSDLPVLLADLGQLLLHLLFRQFW